MVSRYVDVLEEQRHWLGTSMNIDERLALCSLGNGVWFDSRSIKLIWAEVEDARESHFNSIDHGDRGWKASRHDLRETLKEATFAQKLLAVDMIERFWIRNQKDFPELNVPAFDNAVTVESEELREGFVAAVKKAWHLPDPSRDYVEFHVAEPAVHRIGPDSMLKRTFVENVVKEVRRIAFPYL